MVKTLTQFALLFALLLPMTATAQVAPSLPPPLQNPPPMAAPAPPPVQDPSALTAIYQGMQEQWDRVLTPFGNDLFYSLALLDLGFFGWRLWRVGGDMRLIGYDVTNKLLVMSLFWVLLYNGSTWMFDIISSFVTMGKAASGVPGLGPSVMLAQGFHIFGAMLWQATKSGLMLDIPTALAMVIAALLICFSFLVITIQFVMTQVQMFLALGFAKVFLAFGGSRWTTNYVERYFAFSFATGIKLMVLYMLAGAAWPITQTWITRVQALGFSAAGVENAWLIMCGAIIYAVIVVGASAITSSMLGGSPNLTHMDVISFMAPAVTAGVSAAMIAGGITTALGAAGKGAAGMIGTGGASGGASGASAGGVSPTGATPPRISAGGSGLGAIAGKVASQAGQAAQSASRAMSGGASGGNHHPPPSFGGFGSAHN